MKLRTRLFLTSLLALLVPVLIAVAVAAAVVVQNGSRVQDRYFQSAIARVRQDISDTEKRYRVSIAGLAGQDFLKRKLYVYNNYWSYLSTDTLNSDVEVLKDELESSLISESLDTIAVYRLDSETYRSVVIVGNSTYVAESIGKSSVEGSGGTPQYEQTSDGIYATLYMPVFRNGTEIGLVAVQKDFNRGYFENLSLRYQIGIALYTQGLYRYSSLPGIEQAGVLWAQKRPVNNRYFAGTYQHNGLRYRYVGFYVQLGQSANAFLFVGAPSSMTVADWAREFSRLAPVPLACVAIASLLFFLWGSRIIAHIRELLRASNDVSHGTFEVALPVRRSDEFGELFRGFTDMARNLADKQARLEENRRRLVTSERLAAVGQFSAGVAHEINNPLGVILNHVQLLQSGKLSESERATFLARVESEIQRINRLLHGLLRHAASDEPTFQDLDLYPIVNEVVQLFEPKLRHQGVCVTVDPFPGPSTVEGDPDALRQVFFNLIYNALQAIHHPAGSIRISASADTEHLRVRVDDNGDGMDDATMRKIFQPFFTRKHGYGTGLGLAMSRRIIKQHGGSIDISSRIHEGTSVSVVFPRRELV